MLRVLEQHNFRLPVLRFVMDLFDRSVMRRIVLEEDEDEDEDVEDAGQSSSSGTSTEDEQEARSRS